MTIHYVNTKGEEKFISGVKHLQNMNDVFFVASMESGAELKLRISGIEGIYHSDDETNDISQEMKSRSIKNKVKSVEIYTDGACKGNPGPGGWGAIVVEGSKQTELSGGEESTTNNRMELIAVIEAFNLLKEPCNITLTSDSKYVVDAFNKGWITNWQRNGWRKADKSPVANIELWKQLLNLLQTHNGCKIEFVWIKGHAGHPYNERCDQLAVNATNKFRKNT